MITRVEIRRHAIAIAMVVSRAVLALSFIACCVPVKPTAGQSSAPIAAAPVGWLNTEHFRLEQLADGVWAATHTDDGYAISNAGIVDLGDRTLIFDTFMTPEAAIQLRKAAEALTGRPATLVLNSHFQNDHIRGNQVFLPDAQIFATGYTRSAIMTEESEQILYEKQHAPGRLAELRRKLVDAPESEKAELRMWIGYYEGMIRSHPDLRTTVPSITFEDSLTIHGSERQVELIAMGRGHTEDDAVLYLPVERIAFMGDLLFVERHPWLGDGAALEWAKTLRTVYGWGLDTVVPGHEPVGKAETLLTMAGYIESLGSIVERHVEAGANIEDLSTLAIPAAYQDWWYGRFFNPNLHPLYMALKANE